MEQHPILGTNFRMGELNGAVGLAQMRKVGDIRAAKLKNKAYIKSRLAEVEGITFRQMDDEEGDSGTFLNFFLPTQEKAQSAAKQLAEDGLGGFNYWFTNMYHFINQWDHLKELRSPAKMAIHHLGAPQDYKNLELPKSQEVIGRLISLGIKSTWTEEEMKSFADQMIASIKKVG
jgi:8-amino-3,8-dideoxy-alpha-D-manno-octulosonate transaminase